MAKFKSPVTFKGKKEEKVFEKDVPFEMTIKRAEEVQENVKKDYDIDLNFERLDGPGNEDSDQDTDKKENDEEK